MSKYKKRNFKINHADIVKMILVIYDILVINLSFYFALLIRFDGKRKLIPEKILMGWEDNILLYSLIAIMIFVVMRLYKSMWRYAGYSEFLKSICASILAVFVYIFILKLSNQKMPMSYYIIGLVLQTILIVGIRFVYRFYLTTKSKKIKDYKKTKNIMIVGAGDAGEMILKDLNSYKHPDKKAKCIIDDNSNKWNRYIDGVKIVGGRDDILKNVKKYNITTIYVAIPGAIEEARRDILNICNETGCEVKNLPGVYQIVNGDVDISSLREVKIEDLLGRETIKVDMEEIFNFITGKTILVSGAGGSIGGELSRQIASHNPKKLILFDVYENSVYNVEQELKKKYKNLKLEVIIGSVRDSRRVCDVFKEHKPDIVYHAAAHKHVPLMEGSPNEAIKNNVIGTYKMAYAASLFGTKRFVLISTDKAVNPTNIMGASKRLCEMIVQTFDDLLKSGEEEKLEALYTHEGDEIQKLVPRKDIDFVAVRFGNVLGSNGSVIPLFKKQIKEGGPVTVTHPDIIRYFMTIKEAVSLVLQAGTYAKGGEIFVLDMGAPVKIDTLARNLIKLSGLKPDEDIEILYTGLRPGEKLYEEKLMAEEGMDRTPNDLIHIGLPIKFDREKFIGDLKLLMDESYLESDMIKEKVSEIVKTYKITK